jgi:cytochrome c biogenesis protein CcmG/thiol:disulfide interchange protein DsbE
MRKLLIFILFAVFTFGCSKTAQAEKAPNFTLKDLQGKDISLSDFKGKVVLLDFWATWCPPCRKEIPHLVELSQQYEKDGLVVIGLSLDDSKDPVGSFAKQNQINYPVVMANDKVCAAYGGVSAIPTLFLIDRKGDISQKHVGYTDKAVLEKEIKALF